jgi:hypothetical protein
MKPIENTVLLFGDKILSHNTPWASDLGIYGENIFVFLGKICESF